MILAFQDDGSMRVLDTVAEANREYEAIDVEQCLDGSRTEPRNDRKIE